MQYSVLTMGSTPEYGKLTKALHSLLEGMSRVHVIYNNVILATATEAKHGMVVNTVLGKIQESVMTLNLQKPKFFASEVSFWEVLPNKHDMRPDPEKVKALKYATKPGDCQELICFFRTQLFSCRVITWRMPSWWHAQQHPTERQYPQLDLEGLTVDYRLRRSRCYCDGGPLLIIVTDHKPLLGDIRSARQESIRSHRIFICYGHRDPTTPADKAWHSSSQE